MKISFFPNCVFKKDQNYKTVLAAIIFLATSTVSLAQVPPTFTCTSIQVTNTLTSGSMINAQAINAGDTITAADDIMAQQNVNVAGNLSVTGSAIFGSSLTLSGLAGALGGPLMVDNLGNIFKAAPTSPAAWLCFPNAANWTIGGNNVSALQGVNIPPFSDIGTCDAYDFILKSNSNKRIWLKPDGKVGFGIQNPGSTNGTEYQFHDGALRLSGMNTFGGPQIIFDGSLPGLSPHGDWGIEYLNTANSPVPGLNFWKPSGSPNSFNYLFFIGDDGKVGVGNVTNLSSARFNVDGWNGDGIKTLVNSGVKAYSVLDKITNQENFVVYGNGATHMGANAQIGFANIAIVDPISALNINFPNINGIRLNTTNNNIRAIHLYNGDTPSSLFTVFGDGRTKIGGEFNTNSNYMLTVNGKIGAREIKVSIQNPWPDYVFDKNYKLESLNNVQEFTTANKHLPGLPSAKELQKEECGLDVAEMFGKQTEKIENIYLYLFEMKKEIDELKKENKVLKQQLKK